MPRMRAAREIATGAEKARSPAIAPKPAAKGRTLSSLSIFTVHVFTVAWTRIWRYGPVQREVLCATLHVIREDESALRSD